MARAKKSQSDVTTASEGISMILDTPVQKTIEEAASLVGCAEIRLLEMFSERLQSPEVMLWESIPVEHEAFLAEFKQQQEAFNSVRALEPEIPQEVNTVQTETPVEEPPLLEEEPEAPKPKKSSRKSSALTKKKSEAIAQGRAASKQTNQGVKQVLAKLQAQEGIKDAANAGTTYLQAFQATLNHVKGEGLTVLAAEMLQGLSAESDFTPDEILSELGVSLSTETQQALLEKLTPVLGKSEMATQEILMTAWGNGINLNAELSKLSSLLNLED
jgi:hypothetical protein